MRSGVVEGSIAIPATSCLRQCPGPSTMLRMVPLPVPGGIRKPRAEGEEVATVHAALRPSFSAISSWNRRRETLLLWSIGTSSRVIST